MLRPYNTHRLQHDVAALGIHQASYFRSLSDFLLHSNKVAKRRVTLARFWHTFPMLIYTPPPTNITKPKQRDYP